MRLFSLLVLTACGTTDPVETVTNAGPSTPETPPGLKFYTPAWEDGADVPDDYTCDATAGWDSQHNPALVWEHVPEGTVAFAMIFDDPDAGDWRHWAFFVNDPDLRGIPEGSSNTVSLPAGVTELASGDGRIGYVPNCPGGNTHTYQWRLWALDAPLSLDASASFADLEDAAKKAKIDRASFTGVSAAGAR